MSDEPTAARIDDSTKVDALVVAWIQDHTRLPIDGDAHRALVAAISRYGDERAKEALGQCAEIAKKYQDSEMFNAAAISQAQFIEKEIRALIKT